MRKPFLAIADQGVISGTNFLVSLALARVMEGAEYGLYVFGFTTLIIIEGLQNNLVSAPLNVISVRKSRTEWRELVFHSILFYVIISLLVVATLSASYFLLLGTTYSGNAIVLLNLNITAVAFMGSELLRKSFLSILDIGSTLLLDVIAYSIRSLALLAVFFLDVTSSVVVLHFISFGSLVSILIGLRKLKLDLRLMKFNKLVMIEIFDFGKWTLLDWLPFVLSGQLYVYIVTFVLGNEATGALGAIRNFVAPVSILLVSLMNYVLPYFSGTYAKKGGAAFKTTLVSFFAKLILILAVYLTVINVFAGDLLTLVYGKYGEYAFILLLLSLGVALNILFKPFDIYIRVICKPKYIFLSRIGSATVSTLLCYPLVKNYGLSGAAFSYILSQAGMLAMLSFFTMKLRNTALKEDAV
jgi:O-antigen/teichoic acid export membrane protein